ncbi:hypothetical protein TNIN_460431 [Trichonephila inaurata madagascariensis]|uniref:Uncharacterized protein n=1 Tax=Trichonephila inaurata madagascariensis TaxID=2747483 RepID=A0A8X7CFG7_9ARAC|nr:hypothetical protein TNIN_460431 [Trichonephila inaurata madagascariensis]
MVPITPVRVHLMRLRVKPWIINIIRSQVKVRKTGTPCLKGERPILRVMSLLFDIFYLSGSNRPGNRIHQKHPTIFPVDFFFLSAKKKEVFDTTPDPRHHERKLGVLDGIV